MLFLDVMSTFEIHQWRAEGQDELMKKKDIKIRQFDKKGLNKRNLILEWDLVRTISLGTEKV